MQVSGAVICAMMFLAVLTSARWDRDGALGILYSRLRVHRWIDSQPRYSVRVWGGEHVKLMSVPETV